MSIYVFKMPDLGEGTVAAEIVAWHVKPGDNVVEGQPKCRPTRPSSKSRRR